MILRGLWQAFGRVPSGGNQPYGRAPGIRCFRGCRRCNRTIRKAGGNAPRWLRYMTKSHGRDDPPLARGSAHGFALSYPAGRRCACRVRHLLKCWPHLAAVCACRCAAVPPHRRDVIEVTGPSLPLLHQWHLIQFLLIDVCQTPTALETAWSPKRCNPKMDHPAGPLGTRRQVARLARKLAPEAKE